MLTQWPSCDYFFRMDQENLGTGVKGAMSILDIKKFGEPILRNLAQPIENIDDSVLHLIENMFHTMYQAPGVGLAAPQIGASVRLIVTDHTYSRNEPGEPMALINPVILARSDE